MLHSLQTAHRAVNFAIAMVDILLTIPQKLAIRKNVQVMYTLQMVNVLAVLDS